MPDLNNTQQGWYCFKALPKREHIACEFLRRVEGVETFAPRISYVKKTRRGKVRFVECLFPGYVFIYADLCKDYRIIRSIQGIRDVVAFGERVPQIPDEIINGLKEQIGDGDQKDLPEPGLESGKEVVIMEGPFKNLKAVVNSGMNARQRVAVLLEFLGRQMEIQIPAEDLFVEEDPKL
jgi:transcriptional antiterminator RfaH